MAQRRDSGPDPSAVRTWLVVSASSEPEAEPCARPHVRLNEPTRSSDAIVAVRSRPEVKSLPKAAVALEKKGRRKKRFAVHRQNRAETVKHPKRWRTFHVTVLSRLIGYTRSPRGAKTDSTYNIHGSLKRQVRQKASFLRWLGRPRFAAHLYGLQSKRHTQPRSSGR